MKDFAARSKAKAKPQRREPVDFPSVIPINERKWIDIEPGQSSLSAYEISEKVINLYDILKQYNEETTKQLNSGESSFIFGINFDKRSFGLMIVGKHAWQQEEEQKGDISTALIFQEQLFISEFYKDILDAILLILHDRTM